MIMMIVIVILTAADFVVATSWATSARDPGIPPPRISPQTDPNTINQMVVGLNDNAQNGGTFVKGPHCTSNHTVRTRITNYRQSSYELWSKTPHIKSSSLGGLHVVPEY